LLANTKDIVDCKATAEDRIQYRFAFLAFKKAVQNMRNTTEDELKAILQNTPFETFDLNIKKTPSDSLRSWFKQIGLNKIMGDRSADYACWMSEQINKANELQKKPNKPCRR